MFKHWDEMPELKNYDITLFISCAVAGCVGTITLLLVLI